MLLTGFCLIVLIHRLTVLWRERRTHERRRWLDYTIVGTALFGMLYGIATDVVAQKAAALLIMPVGILWLLLIAVTWLLIAKKKTALAITAGSAWLLLTLAGNAWVGDLLLASLERQIPPRSADLNDRYDAVLVLGGGSEFNADGAGVGTAGDRLVTAARLYHTGRTPILVASGFGLAELDTPRDLASESATIWQELGVPASAIMALSKQATITAEEIPSYAKLCRERGWQRVGLISSAWHLPRALRLCERHDFHPVPISCDRRSRIRSWSPYWLIPQKHGFMRVQIACWEYLGMLVGR